MATEVNVEFSEEELVRLNQYAFDQGIAVEIAVREAVRKLVRLADQPETVSAPLEVK